MDDVDRNTDELIHLGCRACRSTAGLPERIGAPNGYYWCATCGTDTGVVTGPGETTEVNGQVISGDDVDAAPLVAEALKNVRGSRNTGVRNVGHPGAPRQEVEEASPDESVEERPRWAGCGQHSAENGKSRRHAMARFLDLPPRRSRRNAPRCGDS